MIFGSRTASAALVVTLTLGVGTATAEVVAVVGAASPIATLSKTQVADIFLGKVNHFPNGSPAVPIDQDQSSPTREEFYSAYAGKSAAQITAYWAKVIFTGRGQPPRAVTNSVEAKKLLAANPQAISYIERSALDGTVKVVGQR